LLLGVVAIALGGIVLLYRGPGQPFVRGHVGDVAATMLVFAIVSLVWMQVRARRAPHVPHVDVPHVDVPHVDVPHVDVPHVDAPPIGARAVLTMVIATSIEVAQVWFHAESTAGHLVLGSTFDWIDLVAYAVGVGIAAAWDRRGERRAQRRAQRGAQRGHRGGRGDQQTARS
jgi:hypothetical protein